MWLKNAAVLDSFFHFVHGDIRVTGDQIDVFCSAGKYQTEEKDTLDLTGKYIIPGLIDIHTHGCKGYYYADADENALPVMSQFLAKNGITSFLPSTATVEDETLLISMRQYREYVQNPVPGATPLGINLEGPYLSVPKAGAHKIEWLQKPVVSHFNWMNRESGNNIKLVSIAPEVEGGMEFIDAMKDKVILALAHSDADYDTAMEAIRRGGSHITHMYNAMNGLHHRKPGMIGAISDTEVTAELICDCVHIHPSVIRATFKMLGDDRIVMISDAISATGLADGDYRLGGLDVLVRDGQAKTPDGTIAGSTCTLMEDVRRAYSIGIPLEKAVKAASYNPAKVLGLEDRLGSIAEGKQADLVVLNEKLQVELVLIKGVPVYDAAKDND